MLGVISAAISHNEKCALLGVVKCQPSTSQLARANCFCVDGEEFQKQGEYQGRQGPQVLKRQLGECCCLCFAWGQLLWKDIGIGDRGGVRSWGLGRNRALMLTSFSHSDPSPSPGLVELHVLLQLLPHLERGGPRLAVQLCISRWAVGMGSAEPFSPHT